MWSLLQRTEWLDPKVYMGGGGDFTTQATAPPPIVQEAKVMLGIIIAYLEYQSCLMHLKGRLLVVYNYSEAVKVAAVCKL